MIIFLFIYYVFSYYFKNGGMIKLKVLEKVSNFATSTFAIWVIFFALIAFFMPNHFTWIAPHVTLLLGIIMFGMGLTLTVDDFKRVFTAPKAVFIGAFSQYLVMPLAAFLLAKILNLPAEVAAGVILVGCVPGGTSSNVMTFLAKGNTALSVTMTAVTTLLAPILTPTLTYIYASQWLAVSFWDMFMSIVKVVFIPIVLGLVLRMLFNKTVEKTMPVLPLISAIGIILVVMAVVSTSHERILTTGLLIFAVVILHNLIGYLAGYLIGKLFKFDLADTKALSVEIGMQNSGLAASLGLAHFTPLAAVPGAIFSVWHNISGALLANWLAKIGNDDKKDEKTA